MKNCANKISFPIDKEFEMLVITYRKNQEMMKEYEDLQQLTNKHYNEKTDCISQLFNVRADLHEETINRKIIIEE